VMIAQQMFVNGINMIPFYSSTIVVEAGYTTKQALLASWELWSREVALRIPAVWTVDSFERRNHLLFFRMCLEGSSD
jgi:hypothetical protein